MMITSFPVQHHRVHLALPHSLFVILFANSKTPSSHNPQYLLNLFAQSWNIIYKVVSELLEYDIGVQFFLSLA